MTDPRDNWTIAHFGLSGIPGNGQGDVPALLRRLADSVAELGDVQIQDITFASAPGEAEDDIYFTVYYIRKPRRRAGWMHETAAE